MLQSEKTAPARSNLKSGLVLFFALSVAALVSMRSPPQLRGTDFPDFYCAARILLDGQARHLYAPALQHQYQAAYAGRVGTLYIHPPFEAALFLIVAWLPLRYAYVLWSLLNIAFLAAATRRLTNEVLPDWSWQIVFAVSLTFVPILLCLQQGQDSLLLLLVITLAFTDLRRQRDFPAGCWMALGLFKFQIVLPLALILFCGEFKKCRWKFMEGFGLVGCGLLAFSAAICGKSVFAAYPAFLIHLPSERFAGIEPGAMPNLRGIVDLLIGSGEPSHAGIVITILSMAFFFWAVFASPARPRHPRDFEIFFAAATLCALLVSYHLNPHDLTLVLLPVFLLLRCRFSDVSVFSRKQGTRMPSRTAVDWALLAVITLLFLPPIHVLALAKHLYALLALPLLLLFFLTRSVFR